MMMIIIIVYIEVEKWKEDSCFNEYFESFVESTMVRFSGQIRFPQTHARQQFFDPSSLHRFRSRTKWKKKRGYLSRVRNFNRIRPSRGSTSIVFTTTIFPSTRESPVWRGWRRFPNSRKTYVRSSRGCASGSSKKRQAGIDYEQVKTNETHETGETVVAFGGGGGGEAVFADEESFHGRRGTMGNLKTRVEHESSFPSFVLRIFFPLQFSSRHASREMNIPRGITIAEDLVFVHDRRRAINRVTPLLGSAPEFRPFLRPSKVWGEGGKNACIKI